MDPKKTSYLDSIYWTHVRRTTFCQ